MHSELLTTGHGICKRNDSQHNVVQCLGDWNKDQIVRRHQIPVKKKDYGLN